MEQKVRVVLQNEGFLVVVPYWAQWPYELLVISKHHFGNFGELTEDTSSQLADIISRTTKLLDRLFQCSFPYSMGFHQTPTENAEKIPENQSFVHFHFHYLPPLLRSATVKKFMVGFELLAEAQRDITPESAASRLRDLL
jgi:UDPglucose--hexose-1-phosphate uridylyltransferase